MPTYTLCKIDPISPFQIGDSKDSVSENAHSDTLFSAIINTFASMYGEEETSDLLRNFTEDPPFRISSTFPYVDNTLLFPLPRIIDLTDYLNDGKEFKDVKYITENIFKKIIKNGSIEEFLNTDNLVQDGKVLLDSSVDSSNKIWSKKENPRVTVDRVTNASEIFHVDEIRYSENSGLYFLMNISDQDISNQVKAAIRLLGDEGLGGNTTYGKGLFNTEMKEVSLPGVEEGYYTSLSLLYPQKTEIGKIDGKFGLAERGGWIYSPRGKSLRKRTIRAFNEGSTFKNNIKGKLVDVTPSEFNKHPVYRYGLEFFIKIGFNNQN